MGVPGYILHELVNLVSTVIVGFIIYNIFFVFLMILWIKIFAYFVF